MCCTITKLPNKHICRNKKAKDRLPVDCWRNLAAPAYRFDILAPWPRSTYSRNWICIFYVYLYIQCMSADLQMIVFWPPSKYNLCAYTHYWSRNYTDSSRAKNKYTIYRFPHSARWPIQPTTHAAKADEYLFCSEINVPSTSKMIKIIQSRLHISIYKFYLLERKRNLAKTDFFFQIHVSKNLILDIYSLSKTRLRLYF